MRVAIVALAMAAAACTDKADEIAKADAKAVGFVPPSVTSRVDYGTLQTRRFAQLDQDADGVLVTGEIARADPRRHDRLKGLDRNGDGEVTSSEYGEGQMARFDAMDLNRDATLTSDERLEARLDP